MPALSFDDKLSLEVLRLEKLRSRILTGLFLLGFVIPLIFFLANYRAIMSTEAAKNIFLITLAFNFGATLYGTFHLMYLNSMPRRRKFNLTLFGRIAHSVVEAVFPAFLLYFISTSFNSPQNVFDSPTFYIYFPIIILSILRLNFFLSVLTGFVSAAGYAILGYIIYDSQRGNPATTIPSLDISVLPKASMLLVCGIVAGFIGNQVRRTIKRMVRAMEDENRIHNLFSQQTSKEVVDEILANEDNEESKMVNLCVMFIDIRNFTEMVGQKSAEEVVHYQNTFFSSVIEVVYKNKGIINQFLGDGCMVTFGAPLPSENPCEDAVKTAYEIKDAIEAKIKDGLLPATTIGIGMHVGDAVVGNIGNDIRQQYSITGSVVILAFRIEKLNKKFGSQILASEDVIWRALRFRNAPQSMGEVQLKGWDKTIGIYKLA